ncbi:hypothetical protein HUB98_07435 [Paenibacillus barcinonensis]|uniref:Uncharacterized protein n=1 Tax=Paenibacillus barcinonensis TaxID=198119 RepID=A0ABX6Q277_PAEBA|nr:hypothetical protein [Paenibacillus barcinonensis]MDM5276645.1 hypothetical protein [Paenibacillus silvae]QKS56192.1 hypothetical protein HUB98_07435 [Paenibacillus barcinonensis]
MQHIGSPAAQTVYPADMLYDMPVPDKVWTKNNAVAFTHEQTKMILGARCSCIKLGRGILT